VPSTSVNCSASRAVRPVVAHKLLTSPSCPYTCLQASTQPQKEVLGAVCSWACWLAAPSWQYEQGCTAALSGAYTHSTDTERGTTKQPVVHNTSCATGTQLHLHNATCTSTAVCPAHICLTAMHLTPDGVHIQLTQRAQSAAVGAANCQFHIHSISIQHPVHVRRTCRFMPTNVRRASPSHAPQSLALLSLPSIKPKVWRTTGTYNSCIAACSSSALGTHICCQHGPTRPNWMIAVTNLILPISCMLHATGT
jgi:hypothetical protein